MHLDGRTIENRVIKVMYLNGYCSWANAGFSEKVDARFQDLMMDKEARFSRSPPALPTPYSSRSHSRSPSPTRSFSPQTPASPLSNSLSSSHSPFTPNSLSGASTPSSSNYLPSPPSSPPSRSLSPPHHHSNYPHHFHGSDSKHHPNRIPESFQIDVDAIRNGYDKRTTLMIRNIPNKYTQDMFLEFVNETHKGKYDFIYLPIDFKNKCNVGYAFINFIDPVSIIDLFTRIQGKKWTRFNSEKICAVSYGRIQGKENLIRHFQNSTIMSEVVDYRPKIFFSTGPMMGLEEIFPEPNVPYNSQFDHSLCCHDAQPRLCYHEQKPFQGGSTGNLNPNPNPNPNPPPSPSHHHANHNPNLGHNHGHGNHNHTTHNHNHPGYQPQQQQQQQQLYEHGGNHHPHHNSNHKFDKYDKMYYSGAGFHPSKNVDQQQMGSIC